MQMRVCICRWILFYFGLFTGIYYIFYCMKYLQRSIYIKSSSISFFQHVPSCLCFAFLPVTTVMEFSNLIYLFIDAACFTSQLQSSASLPDGHLWARVHPYMASIVFDGAREFFWKEDGERELEGQNPVVASPDYSHVLIIAFLLLSFSCFFWFNYRLNWIVYMSTFKQIILI